MLSISPEAAKRILGSIRIPPRPAILTDLMAEREKSDPDPKKIAQIIARDIELSAALLKTINSPFFGLRREIESIDQAVIALGSNNAFSILTGQVLRNINQGKSPHLNRFWENAGNTALIAAFIARRIPGISCYVAYNAGLFHDCGIPLMMARFPDYMETLKLATACRETTFTEIEDGRHSTNHAAIGYLLAMNWQLSKTIALTILHHHDQDIFSSHDVVPAKVSGLIAVIRIAESISDTTQMREDAAWQSDAPMLLNHVGLSDQDLCDISDEVAQIRNA